MPLILVPAAALSGRGQIQDQEDFKNVLQRMIEAAQVKAGNERGKFTIWKE